MAKKSTTATTPKAGKSTPSTQKFLDFNEVRDGVVVMKDGTLRAVLSVSSTNFALKSEDEQNAIVQGYVQFLNSLDFPLQIVIQSRRLDISKYLNELAERERQQTNELLRMQMSDYRQYVSELVELGDIMSKKFYVVVPYDPASDKTRGFFKQVWSAFAAADVIRLSNEQFADRKHVLEQRVSNVAAGLTSMSLVAELLETQQLIELLYNAYNPETSQQQKMVPVEKLDVIT